MGRHADPDPQHFYRSLGVAVLRATGALALVAALFAALSVIGPDLPEDGPVILGGPGDAGENEAPRPTPADSEPAPTADPQPDESPAQREQPPAQDEEPPDPDGGPDPEAGADPDTDAEADPDTDAEALLAAAPPPQETTVQVLDGVGDSPNLGQLVAALEDLGYVVVATNPASVDYAVTTVLYSANREAAARALQARDPRIAEIRPNPGLSEDVDLHVVLGADWQP